MRYFEKIRLSASLKKILVGVVIFLVIFTITGFFIVPPVLKSVLVRKLSENFHREVSIRQIKVNPFALSLDIRGFVMKERNSPETFVSFDELFVDLKSISLVKQALILSEFKIDKPHIHIIRNGDQTYSFSDLIEEFKAKPTSESKPLRFSLNNIRILNGSADFIDGPKHTTHVIRDVNVTIPTLSNLPYYLKTYVRPSFSAVVNGHPFSFSGMTKPFVDSEETSLDIDIKDFDIPYYLAYAPVQMNFKVLSGYIDAKAVFSYTHYRDRMPLIALNGNIDVKRIKVVDTRENPLISLPMLNISIASSDLLEGKIHFSKILFQSPEIDLERSKSGIMNTASLIPEGKAEEKDNKKKKDNPVAFAVDADEIRIAAGKVSFADMSQKSPFKTTLQNIDLNVEHFSNGRDKKSAVAVSLQTEAEESFKLTGNFSLEPPASAGTIELKGIQLKKYSPYYREGVLFDIENGEFGLVTQYLFAKTENDVDVKLSELSVTLNSLMLKKRDEKEDFLRIPTFTVRNTLIDLTKKEIAVGELFTEKGLLKVKRFQDGKLNVASLLPPSSATKRQPQSAKKRQPEKPWLAVLKNVVAENYAVKIEDLVPSERVSIAAERIRLKGENISTAKGVKGKGALSFTLNRKGSVSTSGSVGINPLSASLAVNVKDLSIVPLQPYFTDKVKIIVSDGGISAKGNLSFAYAEGGGIKASYKGEASLAHFSSLDKLNTEDFLKCNSLYLKGLDVGYNPLFLTINEVALTDFYSRLIINPDGSLNVQGIIEQDASKTETPAPEPSRQARADAEKSAAPKTVKIGTVTLQGGTINFSDRSVKPNYSANLLEIGGRISGLSSEENKLADVDLKGKLEDYAPLEITGKINPLREDLYVDLKVNFQDMDLSPVTPYSGKFIGYTIQKGTLSLSLQYLIVKKKLDSQNNVSIDQLTLGDKVESPAATKLPVKLAIALLKNRKGEIKLDIPVTGNIDDPKFSLGQIIVKILVNLLVKAATSPFALLGAIFGGGEELSYLDFDYGSSAINEQGQKKLDTLMKALYERPSLKVDIEGYVDTEKDKEGLRQSMFNRKVKAQKLKDMLKKGLPAVPVDEVKVEQDEYPKYLKMAYKEEKFPKPRNIIGIAKDLPVPEMEKLMLTHIKVTDDDLRQLASQRALTVKEFIMKSGRIEQGRIFLVEPKSLQPEKKEKLRDSRVDFKLK
ncbi:MAG: DUF748 domain-containing protein [Thermodesulfovibrionales bacterium]